MAILVVVLLPNGWPRWVADRNALLKDGSAYARSHIEHVVVSMALIMAIACVLAFALYWVRSIRSPKEFRPSGNVWVHALGARSKNVVPWVGVELTDGRLVEGVLHSYTLTKDDAENRDIALKAPIRVTLKNEQASPTPTSATRVIIPGTQIVAITVVDTDVDGNRVEES
jgi:hypothetical protein